ncbi:MAG: arginine deiminase family protein, partial [Candidatus Methanomethylicia archaeon]
MKFPDRLFDTVIVRPPSITFNKCVSGNPLKATVDVNLAKKQHEEYIKILLENGVEVIKLKSIDQFPDSVFIQDTALIGLKSKRALIARFGEVSRRGEEEDIAILLNEKGFEVFRVEAPGTIEGGDLMITDLGVIYVGLSRRTNIEGIKQLMKIFPRELVIATPIDKTFHLLGGVNYIGNKTIIIAPSLVDLRYFEGL